MKERPILFSATMVRALLSGAKTQTRRVLKAQPPDGAEFQIADVMINMQGERAGFGVWWMDKDRGLMGDGQPTICPYGMRGDRLWVREAWARTIVHPGTEMVVYREGDNRTDYGGPWKPSIHMFRRDSRITLEVTNVRVERLQAISRGNAMAEGCPFANMAAGPDPREWFADLWRQINGPGSWDANPWVWVVEFRRIT